MTTHAHSEKPSVHPRLYFGPEDMNALKEKRDVDPLTAAAWSRVLEMAQAGMALSPAW